MSENPNTNETEAESLQFNVPDQPDWYDMDEEWDDTVGD